MHWGGAGGGGGGGGREGCKEGEDLWHPIKVQSCIAVHTSLVHLLKLKACFQ